jgi:hypothetical protein
LENKKLNIHFKLACEIELSDNEIKIIYASLHEFSKKDLSEEEQLFYIGILNDFSTYEYTYSEIGLFDIFKKYKNENALKSLFSLKSEEGFKIILDMIQNGEPQEKFSYMAFGLKYYPERLEDILSKVKLVGNIKLLDRFNELELSISKQLTTDKPKEEITKVDFSVNRSDIEHGTEAILQEIRTSKRNRSLTSNLKRLYDYSCQVCGRKIYDHNKKEYNIDVHHVIPLGNGGDDNYDNMIVVCKLCHTYIHSGTIAFNHQDLIILNSPIDYKFFSLISFKLNHKLNEKSKRYHWINIFHNILDVSYMPLKNLLDEIDD